MKPYSKELRIRVLAAFERGMPRKEALSRTFGVSEPTVRRYLRGSDASRSVEPCVRGGVRSRHTSM